MKNRILYAATLCLAWLSMSSCEGFLDKEPLTSVTDDSFWVNEASAKAFAFGYYADRFPGFGSTDSGGAYSIRQALNDDFANPTLPGFSGVTSVSSGVWSGYFSDIRRDNIFVSRLPRVKFLNQETADHWMGIARFFRGLDYTYAVLSFGDFPYYDKVLTETDPELYRPRDPRTFVADKALEDLEFAAANVKITDTGTGPDGLVIRRDVVDAFISRQMLFLGTKIKYDPATTPDELERAAAYLQAAKDAAYRVISSGRYSLANNYREICSTVDLTSGNAKNEMILFRIYATGLLTHAIMTSNGINAAQGYAATKDLMDTYLCTNGLPINPVAGANASYRGDKSADQQFANRDPRLAATFYIDQYYPQFENSAYGSTGYRALKFLDEATKADATATQSFNVTDAPIIRLGEVMMNYIEACAELANMGKYTVTQNDIDITINKLRQRSGYGTKLPNLQIIGGQPAVGGVAYDDASRDQSVPSFIWEIRRERRVELVYEGYRLQDLKRWRKLHYLRTNTYPKGNLGAWIEKSATTKAIVVADINGVIISDGATVTGAGYIKPAASERTETGSYVNDNQYLESVPTDQIDLYSRQGVVLTQNPGWE